MNPGNRITKFASQLLMIALVTTTFSLFNITTAAYAKNDARALPLLNEFIQMVKNGKADSLRGIYVPKIMALPVIQQPEENSKFISENNSTATQFNMAARQGNVGLLAHNDLAGKLFFDIQQGAQIILVYGNGRTETFIVKSIQQYEALPQGIYKNTGTQMLWNTSDLFNTMYSGDYHVTLQTCIENNGDFSWGRLFIIAQPVENENAQVLPDTTSLLPPAPPAPPMIFGWPLASLHQGMDEKNKTIRRH